MKVDEKGLGNIPVHLLVQLALLLDSQGPGCPDVGAHRESQPSELVSRRKYLFVRREARVPIGGR